MKRFPRRLGTESPEFLGVEEKLKPKKLVIGYGQQVSPSTHSFMKISSSLLIFPWSSESMIFWTEMPLRLYAGV